MEGISTDQLNSYFDTFVEMTIAYGPKLVLAIVVLVAGMWIINRFVALIGRGLEAREFETTLASFLRSVVSVLFKALLLISVASMVGIETTSFIALLGAAGLAVGLALQGSLANFAGGVLILLYRPYKVGDFVETQEISGTVAEIQIFCTILKTGDNKVIVVPNGLISNGIITNYSTEDTRRAEFVFGIGYGDDIGKAKAVLERLVAGDERVLKDPAHLIVVSELADSSVNFTVRAWVKASNYSSFRYHLTEQVKLTFDQEGISIPYPQTDVHLYRETV